MNALRRYAPILFTAGFVFWLESLITVEWTYPYCLDQADGPAYAAQGFPLPFWMWNGVASLEYEFTPHVYVLNAVILFLLFYPVIRRIWGAGFDGRLAWLQSLVGAAGALMLLGNAALICGLITVGYFRPAVSLELGEYYRYSDFRPVRIGFYRSNSPACTPSRFWFPNGWQHH